MSLRPGPRTRAPAHQNSFSFKHNKNSKKSRAIKAISHWGLCKRCDEQIEWRKKYRKYKPLKAPAHCNGCQQRAVKRAYHTLCDACSKAQGKCAKCTELLTDENAMSVERDDGAAPRLPSEAELAEMSERQRRTALRKASQKPSSGATTPGGAVAATAAGQESMDEVDAQDDAEEDDDDDAEDDVEDDDEDDL